MQVVTIFWVVEDGQLQFTYTEYATKNYGGRVCFARMMVLAANDDGIIEVLLCFPWKKVPGKSIHLMGEKQTRDVASIAGKLRDFDLICIKN